MVVDYASAGVAIVAQLTSALAEAMPILGMILGVMVGLSFFIRIARGRV